MEQSAVLKSSAVNGWKLFWLISLPMSAIMLIEMTGVDMSTGPGISHMIGFSVRFAVPLIFLVVAISSLQVLFPGPVPMWLLRNRRYLGLCFAVAMGWQGFFIAVMSISFRAYYYEDIYLLRDELEGSTGYIFLAAMTLTSFQFARRYLTQQQWKLIHKTGLYFLFAYPFSVYWWNTAYYPNPQPVDYVFYWMGFLAFAARIAAWGKQRLKKTGRAAPERKTPPLLRALGGVMISVGMIAAASGRYWQVPVTEFLTRPQWSADLVLWLPYWPLEPFLPLFAIGLGALLMTKLRAQAR